MRYRIIELPLETRKFVNLTVATCRNAADAIALCARLPVAANVVDNFAHRVIYRNPLAA